MQVALREWSCGFKDIVNSDKKNNDVIDDIPEHLHKSVLQISKESLQSFVKKKS